MYRKFVHAVWGFHILLQSLFSLLTPVLLFGAVAWLLCAKCGVGEWLYAVVIPIGVILGLISMVKFILTTSRTLEHLEAEAAEKDRTEKMRAAGTAEAPAASASQGTETADGQEP